MDTSHINIDDFLIKQAISEDSFGIFFSGQHKTTNQGLLLYGLVSLPERPITHARLTQALSHVKLIEHPALAKVIDHRECEQPQGQDLLNLAQAQGFGTSLSSPLEFLVVYDINADRNLANSQQKLSELEVRALGEQLLEALNLLHKKRAYHHALSPKALWLGDEGIKLSHSGLYSVYKRRGLSLKSSPNPDVDPALIHRQVYASPEELLGKLSTQSSDLFSVAVILYEYLLSPLNEPTIEAGVYNREFSLDLPSEWQEFFQKGMATHIKDRYPSAEQMLKALQSLPPLIHNTADNHLPHQITPEASFKEQEKAQSLDVLEATDVITPQLIAELEEMSEHFDQTHSELDQDEHSSFDINAQTELSEPNPEMDFVGNINELSTETTDAVSINIHHGNLNQQVEDQATSSETDSIESKQDIEKSIDFGSVQAKSQEEPLEESQVNTESSLQVFEAEVTGTTEKVEPQSNFAQTIGFFSGGEVSSEGFKSLRSQLSPESTPASSKQQVHENEVATNYDNLAFGNHTDLAFGSQSSNIDDDLGFGQTHQDERTFIEFSDVDDQTVFEVDQDQLVQESYKTELGLVAPTADPRSPTDPRNAANQPAKMQTMALFSQEADSTSHPAHLQTPDFLDNLGGTDDPSRVLPIPKVQKQNSAFQTPSAPAQVEIPPPLAQTLNVPPQAIEKPPVLSGSLTPAQSTKPSLGLQSSSIMGDAHDWPGQNEVQAVYTPPAQNTPINRETRPVAKLKKDSSLGSRVIGLLIPLILVTLGAVGIYWTQSNWDLVMSLLSSEAPERLSISTYPNDMQVVINNKPVQDRSPLIYNFKEAYTIDQKVPVRFMWKRKIHNEQIKLSNGTTSVYFLAEPMKASKVSRYRRKRPKKAVKFSKASIATPGESLQVLLKDQPIGQTPLLIIAEHGKELSLKLIGPGIEKEIKITPNNTMQSQVSIPMNPKGKE